MQAEFHEFSHARGVEYRDHRCDQRMLALVRQRGRLAGVIVADDGEHAVVLRTPGEVGMLEDVPTAIHAGPFAIPHAEDAVCRGIGIEFDHLRAPQGRSCKLLVETWLEEDACGVEVLASAPSFLLHRAKWRASVPRDNAACAQAGSRIARLVREQEAHQCLSPSHEHASAWLAVLVVYCGLGFES
ncbi:MAG: hypothetical protein QM772_01145 [Ottowia sp.]|uniref:hypothetical protein n=1 Tax=Ottowia sp. TaxID=1898956 RepID=UPI0039E71A83